jgi:signal transduction histidine kinase/ligand-binding sensor domain-containing protein
MRNKPPILHTIRDFRVCLLICFIVSSFQQVRAQKLSSFEQFTFISDFPQNTVQAIYQDAQGYIWVGTESGLNRYDGKRIINYKLGDNDNFKLSGKSINNITEDPDHNLWVATDNGLTLFCPGATPEKNKVLQAIADKINKVNPGKNLECIKAVSGNNMVLGYRTGLKIYNLKTGQLKAPSSIEYNGIRATPFIVNIQEDSHGNIILVTNKHGIYITDKNFTVIRHIAQELFNGKEGFDLYNAVVLPGNKLFIASNRGVYIQRENAALPPEKIKDQQGFLLSAQQFNCLAYDPVKQIVLAGTNAAGIFSFDTAGNVTDHLADDRYSKKLQSNNIFYLLTDKSGLGYWVGNGKGLIKFFFDEDRFASHAVFDEEGSPMRVYPIYTEDNKTVLIGTDRFLMRYNTAKKTMSKVPVENNIDLRFNYIYKVNAAFYLFCTKSGLYYSDNILTTRLKKISSTYPELKLLDNTNILCALKLNENQLLLGTRGINNGGGLVRWNIKEKTADRFVTAANDSTTISDNTVNYLTKSAAGDIIVCTNSGICYFDNTRSSFKRVSMMGKAGINHAQVNAALGEPDVLWIGTYGGGLNKYNYATGKMEYITEKEGLANNDIYALHRGGPDQLWMSTNMGLVLYNTRTGIIRNYDRADGLINNEFNRTSSFKCGDTLYFGGISGINYFNFKNIRPNNMAPVADITRVSLLKGGQEQILFPDSLDKLKLNYDQTTLKLYLASPFYINAGKTVFKHRMLSEQQEWINDGHNNELIITQLQPGKHTLELITISSEGTQSKNTKTIHITVAPPWFQQTWFRILIGLLIAGLAFGFYKLRINQLKREHKIRNQMAGDLHDDLGSTMNSVKVYTNLAMMEKQPEKYLPLIKEGTQEAITGIRDIIWVLDDRKDRIEHLLARISNFASPLCEANHIKYHQQVTDPASAFKLGQEERRNLYMMLKEVINNAIKYAEGQTIAVTISLIKGKPLFQIMDDGKGFDTGQAGDGNGLRNLQRRAAEIKYRLQIDSSAGKGTAILLAKY